jgi:hypothetical protein
MAVEEYKMFGLVSDKCPEIAANNPMPTGRTIFMIKKVYHKTNRKVKRFVIVSKQD